MITYEELHAENHDITELSNVLLYLFKERTMCDTGTCCELFHRYTEKVKHHIDTVDKNLYRGLLTHEDREVQQLARNFMSGSQEIKKIIATYIKTWCPKKKQNETEKLYPMVRELDGKAA